MIWGWTLWPSVIKKSYIRYLSKLSFRVSIPTSVCGLELGKSWPQVPKLCESWRVSILQQIRQTCSVKQRVFWTAVCCLFVGLVTKLCPTLVTPWTVACQAPLPMGFSRQEYWSGLPFLSPGDHPNPGIEPESPALQTDSLLTELWGKPTHSFPGSSAGKESTCNAEDPSLIPGSGRSYGEGYPLQYSCTSLVAQLVKNPPAMQETWVQSLRWEDPWRREQLPTPLFWPGEFHELYSPWGRKESDTTERLIC